MPNVILHVIDAEKGYISAPDFCPFKKVISREFVGKSTSFTVPSPLEYTVVNASICKLCGICQFHATDTFIVTEEDLKKVNDTITNDKELLTTVINQVKFLQKSDRIPLAILISFDILRALLYRIYDGDYFDKKVSAFANYDAPIAIFASLPVYFSSKLTRAPVQVVGEIEWNN